MPRGYWMERGVCLSNGSGIRWVVPIAEWKESPTWFCAWPAWMNNGRQTSLSHLFISSLARLVVKYATGRTVHASNPKEPAMMSLQELQAWWEEQEMDTGADSASLRVEQVADGWRCVFEARYPDHVEVEYFQTMRTEEGAVQACAWRTKHLISCHHP
jgi:hypothetical protein